MESGFDKKLLGQIGLLTGMGMVLSAAGTAAANPVCTTFPCAFSVTSSPAEVTDSLGGSPKDDPKSTTVTFSKFDPSLGTLTEIDFNLTSTLFGSISVSARSASTSEATDTASAQVNWNASYELTLPGGVGFSGSKSDWVNCVGPGFCSDSKSPNFAVTWSDQVTLQSILDQYTGVGGTLDAIFDLNLSLSLINESQPPTSASGGGSATWDPPTQDGLTVTYIYTPNSTVPEPGTLALLGMGAMAGLGFARRRSKSGD